MILISVLFAAVAIVLLLPTVSDLLSLVRALVRPRSARAPLAGDEPRLLFLVPAHNEELLVAETVRSLRAIEYPVPRYDVVVIADNCDDATAEIARAEGAKCLERFDDVRRGKPWALHWALGELPVSSFDAVIVLDADTVVAPDFARQIAAAAPLRDKGFQTYNDVSNPGESALTRMASVFATSRFHLVNALKQRVGINVPLVNGLVLGTNVLAAHGWEAFSICEDWEMYAMLTARGVRIENLPLARNLAQEARSLGQSATQRQRWAAGKITVLIRHGGAVLRSRLIGLPQKLDTLAELTAPGPVVHFGSALLMIGIALLSGIPGRAWIGAALAISVVRLAIYTLLAIAADREPIAAFRAFAFLPLYMVWRLAVQLKVVRMLGDKPWIRTERHTNSTLGAA